MIYSFFDRLSHSRGYSSVVEHSTADREVHGSTPCAPLAKYFYFVFNFCESFTKGRRIEDLTKSLCFYLMILHFYLQTEVQYRVWCPDPFDSRRQCYRRQSYVVSMKRNHHQMAWKSGTLTINLKDSAPHIQRKMSKATKCEFSSMPRAVENWTDPVAGKRTYTSQGILLPKGVSLLQTLSELRPF